ncbi:MAG: Nif3-like dinuclear metal center hexameric protein [Legionellaceae bacterium]|nr:Nif3-like dinuclear metal center hexameric protein [Legionellaceae bacterium]
MATVERGDLEQHLADVLAIHHFKDYAPNGLQIEGSHKIQSICSAVTASQDVIDTTIQCGAQALLVHHGYFWAGEPPILCGMKRKRIASLLHHNINLFAYHLPLDCHSELGNNKGLGQILGIQDMQQHQAGAVAGLLWSGFLAEAVSIADLSTQIRKKLRREPQVIHGHQREVQKIAWCTGGAQDFIQEAYALGADAYISGEISERTYYQAIELGIVYIAAGHHATERFGVQRLGDYLQRTFSIQHQFIDAPNPV